MVAKMSDDGAFPGRPENRRAPRRCLSALPQTRLPTPFELRVARLAKKVKAGVDFIQTQCIYNVDKFEKWMEGVCERGLHEKVYILAGITPMKSVGMAKYMKNKVPGMDVPDELIKRIGGVPKDQQAEEGIKISLEMIDRLKNVKGVAGFHLMAIEWEHRVAEIVERAGLLPRPVF